MLKRLYKHEFIGLYRILLPLYGLLFGLSVIVKLFSKVETDNSFINSFIGLTVGLTAIMAIGLMFASFVLVVVNFYKSLLGKQGYLTFSLPFKAHTHIICKAVCGVVTAITTVLAEFVALIIIFAGYNFFKELHLFIKTFFQALYNEYFGVGKTTLVCFEFVVCTIAVVLSNILMFFAAMAFGQQFKNKVLGAVLSYFGIYIAVQMLMSVSIYIISFFADSIEVNDPFVSIQLGVLLVFLVAGLQAVGYFFISNYFLSKKLNLE